MAKIKLQGHASGTGILTVTAPNTSTDRTITLPDSTGTLLNSDGSGANLTSLPNGSQLDHSGSKKIEAVSTGIDVTGILSCNNNMIVQGGGGASQITMKDSGGTVDGYVYAESGAVGFLDDDGHWALQHTTDARTTFLINNAEKMRILSSGGITFNGDTAAANALDDYEEGTWTPIIYGSGGTSGDNATMSMAAASYTKIGRLVNLAAYIHSIDLSAITSGTYFLMGGLPFAGHQYSDFNIGYKTGGWTSSDAIVGGYTQAGQSYLYFVKPDGTEARQDVGSVALTKMMFNVTYYVS